MGLLQLEYIRRQQTDNRALQPEQDEKPHWELTQPVLKRTLPMMTITHSTLTGERREKNGKKNRIRTKDLQRHSAMMEMKSRTC